tara:strand:- start:916 stop:1185 length:270 start_codon:yes stop_codon:yes gene_type:complete
MKLALFFAFLITSVNGFAQQAPEAPRPVGQYPGAAPQEPLPLIGPAVGPQLSGAELFKLLRTQTAAIQALSSKLDSLEERIRKIEEGPR